HASDSRNCSNRCVDPSPPRSTKRREETAMSRFGVRWLIATLAGAVAVFVWGGLSHLVLLEGVGFSHIAHQERIVSVLRTSLPADGLYVLPSIDLRGTPASAETAAWEARFRTGPTGLIVYHAAGDTPVSPKKIVVQFLSGLFAAGVVAFVLCFTAAPY